MKNTLKTILHSIELFLCASIFVGSISSMMDGVLGLYYLFVPIISALPILPLAAKLSDDIHGNTIKNSIFSVYRNGKIMQNTLAHPKKFLSFLSNKNKKDIFINETLEMFTQLKQKKENGKTIFYHTKSQPMTLYLLRTLRSNGYIENLKSHEAGKMKLFFEKIFLGSKPDMSKKYQMYRISFSLTDKERKKEDLLALLNKKNNKPENNIKQEVSEVEEIKENNKELTIKELKEIRQQILSDQVITEEKEHNKLI